jgi:hypothetical protein
MRALLAMKASSVAALAALGAFFLVGLTYDLHALANELGYQHRLMACIGMYEMKATNLSDEDPRTICDRALAAPTADLD